MGVTPLSGGPLSEDLNPRRNDAVDLVESRFFFTNHAMRPSMAGKLMVMFGYHFLDLAGVVGHHVR
jgi:hypothetical protein